MCYTLCERITKIRDVGVAFAETQVKSVMLTDAGSDEPLCPYHSRNTTTTFQYFQCHIQIDLRYRQG